MTESSTESETTVLKQPLTTTLTASLLACLPAVPLLITLYYDLVMRQGDLPAEKAVHLEAARRIATGELPYIDFWTWSQPIALTVATWPLQIQQLLSQCHAFMRLELISKNLDMAFVLLSFILCQLLLQRAAKDYRPADRLQMPLAVAMAVATYALRFQFGETQHHFILGFMPYIVLRWLRTEVTDQNFIPRWLAFACGLLAGLAVSLDLLYWPLLLLVEALFFLPQLGFKTRMAEYIGLLTALAVALTGLGLLNGEQRDAFLRWIMPLRLGSLMVFDRALLPVTVSPDRRDVIYLLAATFILGSHLIRRLSLLKPLMAMALWGLVIYICQGQGLSEQLALCTYCCYFLATLCSFELVQLTPAGSKKILLTAAGTVLCCLLAIAFYRGSQSACDEALSVMANTPPGKTKLPDVAQTLEKYTKWQDDVLLLSYCPQSIYPTLINLERHQSGYFLTAEPLYLLTMMEEARLLTEDLKNFRTILKQKLAHEFASAQPRLILVDVMRERETLEQYDLLGVLKQSYNRVGLCRYYSAYREPRENIGLCLPFLIYQPRLNPGAGPERTERR
ncbi:MAG: hypothetical protein JSS86_03330 [Cyanobacteria bacterium SZAS LIN-2]|nr:hypothetical protein [Cyanobacteria bacterium SZAS LIN-2]